MSKRRVARMTYEYRCRGCGRTFDVMASIAEKEAGLKPKCPDCGSKKTAQTFGAIGVLSAVKTGSPGGSGGKSSRDPGAGCCG